MTDSTGNALRRRISEIAEREKKATKGPWNWRENEDGNREPQVWAEHYPNGEFAATEGSRGWSICKTRPKSLTKHSVLWPFPFGEHGWEDGQFIAHARADIPFLLSALASERQAVIEECCRAVCYLCAGKHTNYNPQPIASEEYHGIFHVALDAKTDIEKNRTMARCGAAAIRSME